MRVKLKTLISKIIIKIENLKYKDVEIEGNDDIGYRFLITEKKPVTIIVKNKEIVIKRGIVRYTSYCNVLKNELIELIDKSIKDGKEGLLIEINSGCSVNEQFKSEILIVK